MKNQIINAALATALVATGAAVQAKVSNDTTVKVCVGKRDAVVSAKPNGKCPPGARVVKLNQAGPSGAAGATGATGATGDKGETGPEGAAARPSPVSLAGAEAAALGDSNTNRNGPWGYANQAYVPQTAWFHIASARVGQRVRLTHNFSISGTRADQMLAEQVPQVLALVDRPEVVTVMAGTNDVGQGRSAEQVIASLDATYSQLTSAGIRVIAGTVLPSDRWGPEKAPVVAQVNEWIRARQGVAVADFHAALSDATAAPLPGVLMDGTHISTVGAAKMGQVLAPVLADMFPAAGVFPGDGENLIDPGSVQRSAGTATATVPDGFRSGDSVVAMVAFRSTAAADMVTRQIEVTLGAVGTDRTTGVFTDTEGYDGPEVALTTIPRSGLLLSLPMRVPDGASSLSLTVRVTGAADEVQVDRVAVVRVS